jgi:hypothetical protein
MSHDLVFVISMFIGFIGSYVGFFVGMGRSVSFTGGLVGWAVGLGAACVLTAMIF